MFTQRMNSSRISAAAMLCLVLSAGNASASTATDGLNKPCADQTSGGVLRGETRVCNTQEILQFTRLGSRGRDQGLAGDQLQLQGAPASLMISAYVPILNQPATRLGDAHTLAQHMSIAFSEASGLPYSTLGQSHLGTVTFNSGQTALTFLPVGDIIVDPTHPNGVRYLDDGRAEVTVNGLTVTLVSTAVPVTDLMAQLTAMDPEARLELTANGWMKATVNRVVYAVWPGFFANSLTGESGTTLLEMKSDNLLHLTFPTPYQQAHDPTYSGMEQIIYPSFDDLGALKETFRPYDPGLRVGSRMDGTYTAIYQGALHRLIPDYLLDFPVPAEHQSDLWWMQDGKVHFRNRDGSTQAFTATAIPENDIRVSSWSVGSSIPANYTCHGSNKSIPIIWSGIPQYTQSFAIIMDDPDAPGGTFVHWNVFNIRPWVNGVAEGASGSYMPAGAVEGSNDFGSVGYSGPCPTTRHHYFIKVYALKNLISPPVGPMTRNEFELAYGTEIIGSGVITAEYAP